MIFNIYKKLNINDLNQKIAKYQGKPRCVIGVILRVFPEVFNIKKVLLFYSINKIVQSEARPFRLHIE